VYRVLPGTINVIPVAVAEDSDNWHPAWSPDGAFLAYVSTREGMPQLFVTELESGKVRQVTTGARFALAPAWRPVP
jgi:Tol biopolymer transport system component